MPKGYCYTLIDVGLVINQLMGAGYRASYSRKRFKMRYEYNSSKQQQQQSPVSVNNHNKSLQKTNTESSFKVKG